MTFIPNAVLKAAELNALEGKADSATSLAQTAGTSALTAQQAAAVAATAAAAAKATADGIAATAQTAAQTAVNASSVATAAKTAADAAGTAAAAAKTAADAAKAAAAQVAIDVAALKSNPTAINFAGLGSYADDAAAQAAGVGEWGPYLKGGLLAVRTTTTTTPGGGTGTPTPVGGTLSAPTGAAALPAGWTLAFSDDFDFATVGTRGVGVLNPAKWGQRTYGTDLWYAGRMSNGQSWQQATSTTMKGITYWDGTQWRLDGFQQGNQNSNPNAAGYHAGYGQFHVQFKFRFSHFNSPGVGGYWLMWPANNIWGSEIDFLETPGPNKDRVMTTLHRDLRGLYDLSGGNDNYAINQVEGLDLTQWTIIDARRTYRVVNGQRLATFRQWINGVEMGNSTFLYNADRSDFTDVPYLDENMVFGASAFAHRADWYAGTQYPSVALGTPAESSWEMDWVAIWTPAGGG